MPEQPTSNPQPLDYEPPKPADRQHVANRRISAMAVSMFVVFISVASVLLGSDTRALWIAGAVVAGLIVLAEVSRRRPRLKGFTSGVYLGLGFALLCEGICYAFMRH